MRKMTCQEIQGVSLEILKHFDSFCRSHKLRYFLDAGTLLGAARHKGFIPWDDDADIVMPRQDYDRFVKEYADSKKYKLYEPSRDNSWVPYARICEMEKTYFKQVVRWTKVADNPGVGIDIFPLDGAPDSAEEYDSFQAKAVKIRDTLFELRRIASGKRHRGFRRSLLGFTKDCVHYAVWFFRRMNHERLIRWNLARFRRLRLTFPFETSSHCFYIAVVTGRRRFWQRKWFADAVYLDFCGEKFPAPIGYEERLVADYGDWRTPPPESERMTHEANQTMWWRD